MIIHIRLHASMRHAHLPTTRAAIWAAISWLVVLPMLTTHPTHTLMLSAHGAILSHLVVVVATVASHAVVEGTATPWAVVAIVVATHHAWAIASSTIHPPHATH